MQKEEFLKLYKTFISMNYLYEISNDTEMEFSDKKSLWFKLITLNKKRRYNKWYTN